MVDLSIRLAWIIVGFVIGAASTLAAAERSETLYQKLEVLAEVFGEIESSYVDMTPPTELIYGAAKGAVGRLDPHSAFYTPREYEALRTATDGEYAGIGVEIGRDESGFFVGAIYPSSPAAAAGLQTGDRLLEVDGVNTKGATLTDIQRNLRGPVGTKVLIRVSRKGRNDDWTFTLVRGWIRLTPLEADVLDHGIHYAHIKTFASRISIDLRAHLDKHPPEKGLILDLRGNPGGLFDEAVAICDLFLSEGPIVTVVGRSGQNSERHLAHPEATQADYPVAVLIDGGSASAAEIVAGCLKDRKRAKVFGSKSYGKGSVQSILDLSDGSGLKLTVARYLTPAGTQIDGRGINPDVGYDRDDRIGPLHGATEWLIAEN